MTTTALVEKKPYLYQQICIDRTNKKSKLFLQWQMRMGKSPTVLWWAMDRKLKPERILILMPKSVIVSWAKELDEFGLSYLILDNTNRSIHDSLGRFPCICLANYELIVPRTRKEKKSAKKNGEVQLLGGVSIDTTPINMTNKAMKEETFVGEESPLLFQPWDLIILDESHRVRNPQTALVRTLLDDRNRGYFPAKPLPDRSDDYLSERAKENCEQMRVCLTGTPNPEGYLDLFCQFKFLYGTMGGYKNYRDFNQIFFEQHPEKPNKRIPKSCYFEKLAHYIDRNAEVLSRKQINIDLPAQTVNRYIDLSPDAFKKYREFEANWFSEFVAEAMRTGELQKKSIGQLSTQWAAVAMNYLHQIACGYPKQVEWCSHHKLDQLTEDLTSELYGEKVVIWCKYSREIAVIKEHLDNLFESGQCLARPAVIDGATSTDELKKILDGFREDLPEKPLKWWERRDCNVNQYLVCQIKKASVGMDFSSADTAIFFSRSYSRLENDQAIERLVHPEKLRKKNFTNLLTINYISKDTIDQDLDRVLIEKREHADAWKYFIQRTGFDIPQSERGMVTCQ